MPSAQRPVPAASVSVSLAEPGSSGSRRNSNGRRAAPGSDSALLRFNAIPARIRQAAPFLFSAPAWAQLVVDGSSRRHGCAGQHGTVVTCFAPCPRTSQSFQTVSFTNPFTNRCMKHSRNPKRRGACRDDLRPGDSLASQKNQNPGDSPMSPESVEYQLNQRAVVLEDACRCEGA
jgi:hypothetical protein